MLEALASKEELSPAVFSLSVLNASTGLFSMLEKNFAPSTAISAGCSSFSYGLLEACTQLDENPGQSVLLVYADEPIPDIYGETEQFGCGAHAIGLLLQTSAATHIRCSMVSGNAVPSDEVQSRTFMRCLEIGEANWCGEGKTWFWKRVG